MHQSLVLNDHLNNILRAVTDNKLGPVCKRNDGIGSALNGDNQVSVQVVFCSIESCKCNHSLIKSKILNQIFAWFSCNIVPILIG